MNVKPNTRPWKRPEVKFDEKKPHHRVEPIT